MADTVKTKVLVSACMLGQPVRYDGAAATAAPFDILEQWRAEGRVVPICPEVAGGLPVPRPPAEIQGGDGADVLEDEARVMTGDGTDVTRHYLRGARAALQLALTEGVKIAVLKERSPSCGSGQIYDGSHSKTITTGEGVTTALLRANGIEVFGESELEAAAARVQELDARLSVGG